MTVIVANDVPDSIRGILKRWFIEPRPNVFVGTLNSKTHGKVMDFIERNRPLELGFLIVASANNCQGYIIERVGPCGYQGRQPYLKSGISLIAETWIDPQNTPF